MKIKVSEVKVGDEFRFYGWNIRVTEIKVLPPLYDNWKDHPTKHNQYEMTFDILDEGLFRDKTGWSFCHFYADEEIDTESAPEECEECGEDD